VQYVLYSRRRSAILAKRGGAIAADWTAEWAPERPPGPEAATVRGPAATAAASAMSTMAARSTKEKRPVGAGWLGTVRTGWSKPRTRGQGLYSTCGMVYCRILG
jgi:hypothetical protein